MADRQHDRRLGINTVGLREWRRSHGKYNRYEATSYRALNKLFESYRFIPGDHVVDFGVGRGRVAFAIHNRFHVPVTGIEAHDKTYEEALANKLRYRQKAGHIPAPIRLEFGLAEHYQVGPEENKFYFFNPFSKDIFRQVVGNILESVEKAQRPVDIILYYPLPEHKKLLRRASFVTINKIRTPSPMDKHDKFIIYRLPVSNSKQKPD